jgi:nucleoid-associated protein YgaU
MKRNETVLVYAVTGLLLVILLVAVIFGEQNPAQAETEKKTRPAVASLPGVAPAEAPVRAPSAAKPSEEPGANLAEEPSGEPSGEPSEEPSEETGEGEKPADEGTEGADAKSGEPVVLKSTVTEDLAGVLGTSSRMGEYRVVKARRGDTLALVAARWCADATQLSTVEVLNESLVEADLESGQEVVVPWVDAETLLLAAKARAKKSSVVEHAKGQLYTIKKGDSLWDLAKVRVAKNKIPAWLGRFKVLNPDIIDLSVLIAGQKVRLPN